MKNKDKVIKAAYEAEEKVREERGKKGGKKAEK